LDFQHCHLSRNRWRHVMFWRVRRSPKVKELICIWHPMNCVSTPQSWSVEYVSFLNIRVRELTFFWHRRIGCHFGLARAVSLCCSVTTARGLPVAAKWGSRHNEVVGAATAHLLTKSFQSAVVSEGVAETVNSRRNVNEPAKYTVSNIAVQNRNESEVSSCSKVPPTIVLSSPLASHLAKFENCSDYQWNARERLCHLKSSLDGLAGQVLWQLPK